MHDALTVYFNGEKSAGLVLAGLATTAIVFASLLFRAGGGFRSFATTLVLLALAEAALGVGLHARTGPQVRGLEDQLRSDSPSFYSAERARMARVQRNFVLVEYVEALLIVTTALAALFLKTHSGLLGVALGLLINGSVLLAFDLFAERRGAEYLEAIVHHSPST
jgi:hypothetical protein